MYIYIYIYMYVYSISTISIMIAGCDGGRRHCVGTTLYLYYIYRYIYYNSNSNSNSILYPVLRHCGSALGDWRARTA